MRVGLQAAGELKPAIDICVVMTDGFTPWPAAETPFKTIIVLTNKDGLPHAPSWAKRIVVN